MDTFKTAFNSDYLCHKFSDAISIIDNDIDEAL